MYLVRARARILEYIVAYWFGLGIGVGVGVGSKLCRRCKHVRHSWFVTVWHLVGRCLVLKLVNVAVATGVPNANSRKGVLEPSGRPGPAWVVQAILTRS